MLGSVPCPMQTIAVPVFTPWAVLFFPSLPWAVLFFPPPPWAVVPAPGGAPVSLGFLKLGISLVHGSLQTLCGLCYCPVTPAVTSRHAIWKVVRGLQDQLLLSITVLNGSLQTLCGLCYCPVTAAMTSRYAVWKRVCNLEGACNLDGAVKTPICSVSPISMICFGRSVAFAAALLPLQ